MIIVICRSFSCQCQGTLQETAQKSCYASCRSQCQTHPVRTEVYQRTWDPASCRQRCCSLRKESARRRGCPLSSLRLSTEPYVRSFHPCLAMHDATAFAASIGYDHKLADDLFEFAQQTTSCHPRCRPLGCCYCCFTDRDLAHRSTLPPCHLGHASYLTRRHCDWRCTSLCHHLLAPPTYRCTALALPDDDAPHPIRGVPSPHFSQRKRCPLAPATRLAQFIFSHRQCEHPHQRSAQLPTRAT